MQESDSGGLEQYSFQEGLIIVVEIIYGLIYGGIITSW